MNLLACGSFLFFIFFLVDHGPPVSAINILWSKESLETSKKERLTGQTSGWSWYKSWHTFLATSLSTRLLYCTIQSEHTDLAIKGNVAHLSHGLRGPIQLDKPVWTVKDSTMHMTLRKNNKDWRGLKTFTYRHFGSVCSSCCFSQRYVLSRSTLRHKHTQDRKCLLKFNPEEIPFPLMWETEYFYNRDHRKLLLEFLRH